LRSSRDSLSGRLLMQPKFMPAKKPPAPAGPAASWPVFAIVAGLFFFVTILKFGSPVVMDSKIDVPQDLTSTFYDLWPPHWGAWLFVPVAVVGLWAVDLSGTKLRWALFLPLIWLGWELVAATQTVSLPLTKLTIMHFAVCVSLFYLGFFARKGMSNPWPIWAGMGLALCWAMRAGIEQHFGGLEATRKMLMESPATMGADAQMLANPDYLKRIASNRIFGTFAGYPNGLAGGLILFLPLTLAFLWRLTPKVRDSIRILFVLILGGCGLACLYWSGSKAGWLVALAVGLVALGHSALPLKWKRWLIYGVLIAGVAGFAIKYSSFFQKERNSVGARFAYWRAALIVIDRHPILGTGPGTFQIPYAQIKRPGDEMARLCHNDYLEQATDSGIFGFMIYGAMVFTLLLRLYRYSIKEKPINWLSFGVWLGMFGLCLHSLVEFHLYVPALAWPLFFLFGWLMSLNS
jgi:O-antigen ligase